MYTLAFAFIHALTLRCFKRMFGFRFLYKPGFWY